MLAAESPRALKQQLESEMENRVNNLFLVGFNLLFINFVLYAWKN